VTSPNYLGELWPAFLLGEYGPTAGGAGLLDRLVPADPAEFRALLSPVLTRTNPTAAHGLTLVSDAQLAGWIRVLREPRLNGDLLLTPAWLSDHGMMAAALARLLTLPFYERMDVMLHALHHQMHEVAA
jgi:hypothetical protein